MDDAFAVGVRECVTHTRKKLRDTDHAPFRLGTAHQRDDLRERATLHQLHREVEPSVLADAEIVDGHDSRVIEPRGDLCFVEKSLLQHLRHGVVIARVTAEHDLHRQIAAEELVLQSVDHAHAASSDLPVEAKRRASPLLQQLEQSGPVPGPRLEVESLKLVGDRRLVSPEETLVDAETADRTGSPVGAIQLAETSENLRRVSLHPTARMPSRLSIPQAVPVEIGPVDLAPYKATPCSFAALGRDTDRVIFFETPLPG